MQAETFKLERTFNAPRELVYKAWTDAEHLAQWWGPKDFKLRVKDLDTVPGGIFHYAITSPDGMDIWARFVYRELIEPERIVFVSSFTDADGNAGHNPPWMPDWPTELLNTITLTEVDGKTKLTLTATPLNATDKQNNAFAKTIPSLHVGYKGTFDKLDDLLAGLIQK